jgi:predicted transposase/invertase (TIGR01784 family)
MDYIFHTHEISRDKLKNILDESKIDGGDIMYTLAQQMKDEIREEFKEEFKEEFVQTVGPQLKDEGKKEGKKEGKEETARELIKRGVDINIIAEATGFPKEEIEKLAAAVH